MSHDIDHGNWMRRALELAERGRGMVEPNPLVGAVLVRDGVTVGEGWHERYGQAHAEVNALAMAGERARGATLYVTLEPCCHVGKTPPCTDAVIRAGVAAVYASLQDPFPQVAGKGAAQLKQAGIPLEFGLGEAEARRQNAPYLTLLGQKRPYVHAKWAMTLDGKIATHRGDSKWISNEASRRRVHELRGRMDAIVVGSGTALADDPHLTARPPGPRVATRVVLDRRGRLPLSAHLVTTARDIPTLIVTSNATQARLYEQAGCEVFAGSFHEMLRDFARRRWTNLLVEGGAEVLGAFHDAGAIDEVHVFIAAKSIGGADARTPIAGTGRGTIADAMTWPDATMENIEGDWYLHGRRESPRK